VQKIRADNLIGAITANVYMLLVIAVFVARMLGQLEIGRWIGLVSTLALIPVAHLFVAGLHTNRRRIYFMWLSIMALFLLFELVVDHVLSIDFRSVRWAIVPYVMFFFGATGGMIGVAAQAGKSWTTLTSLIFLTMAALAFIQHSTTGL
jgi:hypothetical protein